MHVPTLAPSSNGGPNCPQALAGEQPGSGISLRALPPDRLMAALGATMNVNVVQNHPTTQDPIQNPNGNAHSTDGQ